MTPKEVKNIFSIIKARFIGMDKGVFADFRWEFDEVETALNRLEELEKILKIIKEKGVAVGFIQLLLLTENCGGLREYSDYIGDNKLYLTETDFNLLKEYLK